MLLGQLALFVLGMKVVELIFDYLYESYLSPRIAAQKNKKAMLINQCLQRIIRATDAIRVVVVEIDNFERKYFKKYEENPDTLEELVYKSNMHSTVIFESHNSDVEPLQDKWQGIFFDQQYFKLIATLLKEKNINLSTDDLPESKLKHVYMSYNVLKSVIYKLFSGQKKMYYIAINFTKEEISHYDQMIIQGESDLIKNIL